MNTVTASTKTKRPFVFLGVGILNTLFDFLFYTFLTSTAFKYGHNIALAGIISGTFALFVAFLMHSFITWRGTYISHRTFLKFFVFTGFGMWAIRPLLLALFIKFDGLYHFAHDISQNLGLPFSYNFVVNTGAFGFMVIIVLLYNYFVYDRYVFTSKQPTRTELGSHSAS